MLHLLLALSPAPALQAPPNWPDEPRVVLIGNALAERMQHHGWLETGLQTQLPSLGLSVRNLGFSADELTVRQRTQGFGTQDEWLARTEADVILAFFGYVESFAGPEGVDAFVADLEQFVEHTRGQAYGGVRPPTLVLFTSIPFEDTGNPYLPDAAGENERIRAYNEAIASVARGAGIRCVDLFEPMQARYADEEEPLTLNGIHLTERGNEVLAEVIQHALLPEARRVDAERRAAVRELVLEKNHLWFNRYRATDGYNVYGGRSTLEYDGVTNATVLQRELEVLDAMCAELDGRIQAVARGEEDPGARRELPEQIPVATNRPGDGPDGTHTFLAGDEAIANMTLAEGLRANLYADEVRFPRLVNPVQMSWDPRGRLWVAVWPTYPHWQPGTPMNDALLILEDDDGDGVADRSKVFADGLHNPTGFEFWNGGVFVANPPDLLFLKDTDGDDVADERTRVLHGLSSADTHHSANSFVLGPDGALYFQEGIFHQSQIETAYGPMRSRDACVWRFDPRSWRVERYMAYGFLNPHGHVFDRWGQDFVTDGTGNVNYYALPATGFLEEPAKHPSYFPFFQQRSRPAAGTEILSSAHFPAENQGNYLIANVIGFQGIFQYAIEDDGSGFKATEVEPIVHSSDPRFRPSDIEMGPDGGIYFLDWHNPLIGHMQHHLRDPSRDKAHGRVYRITHEGRPLSTPEDLTRLSVDQLLERLRSPEDRVRYRTRIELSGRPSRDVRDRIPLVEDRDEAFSHVELERLWVYHQHGELDDRGRQLFYRVLRSEDPRAIAAAIRLMRRFPSYETLLYMCEYVLHPNPRVRLECVVGLSFFAGLDWRPIKDPGTTAAYGLFRSFGQERDRFLDYAFEETLRALEPEWKPALIRGEQRLGAREDEDEVLAFLLRRLEADELERMGPGVPVWTEILARPMFPSERYAGAARELAKARGGDACTELIDAIRRADAADGGHADHHVMGLFDALGDGCNDAHAAALAELATDARRATTRRRATACRLRSGDAVVAAWDEAARRPAGLVDLLDAAPLVADAGAREALFARALALVERAPDDDAPATLGRTVRVELPGAKRTLTLAEVEVVSNGVNVARGGAATQSSVNWGGVPERALDGVTSGRWGDGGQTHTVEDRPDPWWEVDLGAEHPIDSIVVWNRTDGSFGRRLDGFVVRVLDAERRSVVVERGGEAPRERATIELADPALRTRRAALAALTALRTREAEAVAAVTKSFDDPRLRASAVAAARSIPFDAWPAGPRDELAAKLGATLDVASDDELTTRAGRELLALAEELAPTLDADAAAMLRAAGDRGPVVLLVRPVRDRMLYDRTELTVPAGRRVELVFENVDIMPHNLVLAVPGALATVGLAAEAMAADPDAWSRAYVPDLDEVLVATRLLQPGESETLSFDAPAEPGDYPYVCTFPGHWVRMNGVLHVVDADAAVADAGPAAPVEAAAIAGRTFVRDWTTSDFRRDLRKLRGVDVERGRAIFTEATCILCHRVADDPESGGGVTGPDMRQIARANGLSEILTQVFEPSKRIADGYASEIFVTTDGLVHAGRVLAETDAYVVVQDDPYREDGLEIAKDEIESRTVSNVSAMPSGLLTTFEKDEILDLVAFIRSLKDRAR